MSTNAHLAAVIALDTGACQHGVAVAAGATADPSIGAHAIDAAAGVTVAHTADVYANVHTNLDLWHDCCQL